MRANAHLLLTDALGPVRDPPLGGSAPMWRCRQVVRRNAAAERQGPRPNRRAVGADSARPPGSLRPRRHSSLHSPRSNHAPPPSTSDCPLIRVQKNWGRLSNQTAGIGRSALRRNTEGSGNIAIGYGAGRNRLTGSNNVYIGNAGVGDEEGTIRIGTEGVHNRIYLAGEIVGGGVAAVYQ